MPGVDITKNYERHRIRDPALFDKSTFRTIDIGSPGIHKLVRAKLKKTGEYRTQSVIVELKHAKDPEVKKQTAQIVKIEKEAGDY